MCGIVAYIGDQDAFPLIIKGLKRLEYRGYDSTGVSVHDHGLKVYKKAGKVADLVAAVEGQKINGTIGIGHTRWATHGEPNDRNAHPHFSANKSLSIIHNGIIENYDTIKEQLLSKGYSFVSDTDTEVLITFIEDIKKQNNVDLEQAVRSALHAVEGAYAIVILDEENPDQLIAARKGSPMVLGIGNKEYFIASDATPIIEYTNEVVYLKDREIAIVNREGFRITNIDDVEQTPYIQKVEMKLEELEKGGYEHFMLKEIFEQPNSIADSMRGRLDAVNGNLTLGGIYEYAQALINSRRIIILACGTSWHSGLVAEYLFEEYCRIPVEVEYASEFRYRNPVIHEGDIVIAISQSGETADTLAAIELAKSKGAIILGIVNVVGSSISRVTHEGAYLHTGPEIGVASTKAFTGQLSVLTMIALSVAHKKGTITQTRYKELLVELSRIPAKIKEVLDNNSVVEEIAERFKDAKNFIYLGRGYNFPVALEGALKLKEISYIHAEGYPAAEMKHGPIALIDEEMPVVFIATRDSSYDKVVSNIQEVKARKGVVIAVVTKGDALIPALADYIIEVPACEEALMPLVSVIPLQLLSYHIAVMRGCNVDQPRNLAKSVTVE
ncbi:glutamine--fructose-6-phosphate transaminase (isomerizing) [Reichenbachiella carrageenanivorans]|uniref:Glutamine--fructose-6-phosphate aminotransferase [isomerizing] n=1 Tax=Reichenbachiella carrageenanivorans TaxID=2979869 RepID=A0ABY6D6H4_9BACT|nr:glutamine--fructose-6-phosphate transaminase (isomerizing) [Reichenbachiella carrageenanivorans]UXX80748.1 glutamine--fructose-6-phosphate transaminase (isomerizing) [Reichenbachiella carrageenanivorans]